MGIPETLKNAQQRYDAKCKRVSFRLTPNEQQKIKTDENYSRLAKRLFLDYCKENTGGNENEPI